MILLEFSHMSAVARRPVPMLPLPRPVSFDGVFVDSEKTTLLEHFDMYLVVLDIFNQYSFIFSQHLVMYLVITMYQVQQIPYGNTVTRKLRVGSAADMFSKNADSK